MTLKKNPAGVPYPSPINKLMPLYLIKLSWSTTSAKSQQHSLRQTEGWLGSLPFQQPLGAFEGGLTGGATILLRYIVKFEHGYYEAYSDQTCSCKGKQVINLGQFIILASKFCSFPGKIGKHQGHFSLIHWNLLSENQPRSRRSLLHPFLK